MNARENNKTEKNQSRVFFYERFFLNENRRRTGRGSTLSGECDGAANGGGGGGGAGKCGGGGLREEGGSGGINRRGAAAWGRGKVRRRGFPCPPWTRRQRRRAGRGEGAGVGRRPGLGPAGARVLFFKISSAENNSQKNK